MYPLMVPAKPLKRRFPLASGGGIPYAPFRYCMKVTLFPFLSVLLCMMGAMIMLLVVVARNVQSLPTGELPPSPPQKTAQETEKLQEQREFVRMQTEEAEWFADQLRIVQKRAEADLADGQAKLAAAEKETERVKAEILRLQQLAEQLNKQTSADPAEMDRLKQMLAQQKERLQREELELAELRKQAAENRKSYAIVPHKGENGTFRRPIYIECKANKIIIQPEGIELVPNDFAAADRPDNPFDSVLRTIRQYYLENNQVARGSEPYPLMVIRPSGVEMYEQARQALGNWVKDFGYEIVNEDWNVVYPAANDDLRNRIAQQLEVSRNRLSGYLVAERLAGRDGNRHGGGSPRFRMDHRGNVIPLGNGGGVPHREGQPNPSASTNAPPSSSQNTANSSQSSPLLPPPSSQWDGDSSPIAGQPQPVPPSSPRSSPAVPQPPTADLHAPHAGEPAKRAENWGLKDAARFSSAISRTVKIRCEKDRFVLAAQAGLERERSVLIGDSVQAAADELVKAVWEFQETWGIAGERMYWKPILRVNVLSGGEQRYRELQSILKNSGLAVENQ